MFTDAFDEVDWPQVHRTLNEEVLRLFQVWASKTTNKNLLWRHHDGRSNKCPCCTIHVEMAEHVILCPEEGRVEVFMQSLLFLEWWLRHRVQLVGGLLIEPLVRGSNPSGARVQWIGSCWTLGQQFKPSHAGVFLRGGGWGPTCPNRVHLGIDSPGMASKNHRTLTGQDTRDWGHPESGNTIG
jgi:hypothetical protein